MTPRGSFSDLAAGERLVVRDNAAMPGQSAPDSPSAGRARGGGPGRLVLLVAAAVCILIGRGLGLFGGGAADERRPERPKFVGDAQPSTGGAGGEVPASTPPPTTATAPSPDGAESTNALASSSADTADAGRRDVPPATPPADSAAPVSHGIDADRFEAIRSLVQARREEGRFGPAFAAIDNALGMPLSDTQRAVLERDRRDVDGEATKGIDDVRLFVAAGRVLGARRAAAAMLEQAQAPLHRRLLTAIGGGPVEDALRVPEQGALPWPVPTPMAKDRVVDVWGDAHKLSGRVVDARSDEVTLRVQEGQDVTFPTIKVVECEPRDVTCAEAVELGFAALHAKDGLLARLWLACANQRRSGGADARTNRLAALLQ